MRVAWFIYLALNCFVMASTANTKSLVTFHDPVMDFTLSYPDDFRSLPSVEPQLGGCLTIPLRLAGKSERPYERVLVHEIDYDCLHRAAPEIASLTESTGNDLMKVYGSLEISTPNEFLIDDHPAAFITAKAKVKQTMKGLEPGMTLYAVQTCIALKNRVACWNVLTSDQTRLKNLLAGKIVFRGQPAHTWVPSGSRDILGVLPE